MARTKKTKAPSRDLYQEITDRIVEALEKGEMAPWHRPWALSRFGSTPRNAVTGRPYRGINVMLTMMTAWSRDYTIPLWLSFKQANEVAGKAMRKAGRAVEQNARGTWVFADGEDKGKSCGGIRAGQNKENGAGATEVVFWKPVRKTEKDSAGNETVSSFLIMRTYSVFNIAQCDDHVIQFLCPPEAPAAEFSPIEAAEAICAAYECKTAHGGDRAFYSPAKDLIQLPEREAFETPEHYYTTRFHEMGHSTGHVSRLNRPEVASIGVRAHQYAEEELVAEFTACFLAGEAGIMRTVEDNSASYLRNWAAKLKDNKKILIQAAQRAQKAADFVLGRKAPGVSEEVSQAA